uniref:CCDC174 alpha/beta GRSR domain-containing protein n=1 Tax=Anopheles christyi TaxID=43041 RepID=A0A182JUR7_9DIPT
MNDPNRKIEIDKSSLLSLKAELLRKQEEVGRAKASTSIEDFVPKKAPRPEKDASTKRKERRDKNDSAQSTVTELEDSAQLARSKQVLVAKAKYYERMVAAGGSLNSDENSLVMFNKKKQDTKPAPYSSPEPSSEESNADSESSDSEGVEDGDKWVDYTDCLGRTRNCLKRDLKECLARDKELAKSMAPREGQRREDLQGSSAGNGIPPVRETSQTTSTNPQKEEEEDGEIVGPMPPTMSQTGDTELGERFREMKEQWVQQEEANLDKSSIHYQDVLFDG